MDTMEQLKTVYYNPKAPGSFGGVKRLAGASGVSTSIAKKWLSQQDTYTLHKPIRYKFSRRKTIAYGINELWQSDLVDLQKIAKYNKGYKYLLTIIDVMSRYLRVIPIKDKKAATIAKSFKKLLKKTKPVLLQTDKGTEFYNKVFKHLLRKNSIHHYSTKSDTKCAILERCHRTLRNLMYRVFTYRNSYKYYDVLQSLVDSYNNSIHSSHGFAPAKITHDDEPTIYQRLYQYQTFSKFRFAVGDIVRISKAHRTFKKGYLPGWTEETFKVYKRYPTTPHTYTLRDFNEKEIEGRFYAEELQKIEKTPDDYWAVEKILAKKGRGKSQKFLVKWVGFDDSFNSWIKKEWIKI